MLAVSVFVVAAAVTVAVAVGVSLPLFSLLVDVIDIFVSRVCSLCWWM